MRNPFDFDVSRATYGSLPEGVDRICRNCSLGATAENGQEHTFRYEFAPGFAMYGGRNYALRLIDRRQELWEVSFDPEVGGPLWIRRADYVQ